ncbi:MAG: DUF4129 domain-containing protein [Roseiflexaceae bacterium]|nr:DUF4129 domain-containing protein [Roseiflexaceae bacterium]
MIALQHAILLLATALPQPASMDEYEALLRAATAAAQRSDRLGLETVAGQLAAITTVDLPGGGSAPADTRWLEGALASNDPDFAAIAARLGATIDALALPASATPADALARLDAIVNNPPFSEAAPVDLSWWENLLDWLGRVLDGLFQPVGSAVNAGGEPIAWVIGTIGVLLLLAVIIYLLIGLRRSVVANARAKSADPEANLTAKSALEQASETARGGDHRTGMRFLYLSALLWLDERDLLRYDRALTNREYLERVGDNPLLRGRLQPIVETFDRVWYGHAPLDDAAFDAYRKQIEALRADVTR